MSARHLPIEAFCRVGSGGTPSRAQSDRYYGGDIPWVKSGELREGVIEETEERITAAALRETAVKPVPKGAILVAMYGATIGRVGILGIEATTNQAVCHVVPDLGKADTRYLFHALRGCFDEFIAKGVGGAQPNISQQIIRQTPVYLPELLEQRRIAAILDQVDALRAKRRAALAQLDEMARAIFVDLIGDPATNPKAWPSTQLGAICHVRGGKRLPKGAPYAPGPTPHPYIRVSDLSDGAIGEANLVFLTPEVQRQIARYTVTAGEIVISIAGTIGAVAVVPEGLDGANLTENAAKLVAVHSGQYDSTYLATYLRTPFAQEQIGARTGQVTIGKLALFRIEQLPVLLPPMPIQQELTARVARIDALRQIHLRHEAEMDGLFTSLQHRAFRGEL